MMVYRIVMYKKFSNGVIFIYPDFDQL